MGQRRVAVVGGGLAGLSAALELKRRGFEVELFERGRLLGGKATSFTIDHPDGPLEVDNGQHVFLACCTAFIDFVERSGASGPAANGPSPLHLQDRFEAVMLTRGKRPALLKAINLPAPWHLVPALAGYHHLALTDRLRLGWALVAARRRVEQDETFARWLDRHFQGPEARRAFWDPFLVPALNAPLNCVSARAALFVITTAFLSGRDAARFGFSRVPLRRLADAAAAQLDGVHLRTPISSLEMDGRTFKALRLTDGETRHFDAAVLAVPPRNLKHLLGDPAAFGVSGLDAFRSEPIVDVHLWYDQVSLGSGFAAVLDSPVQWVFEKAPGYLCCSLSAAGEYVSRPVDDLVELCHRELVSVLPSLGTAQLIHGAATRDRAATFVPVPALHRPGPTTLSPQITIAGAWTDTGWPATMESAVRSGRTAASVLAGTLGA